ncbi:hypothetical protein BJV41_003933 [Clostridium beijerinckii]|nr:hypothetical protein [Clostridium beijerinckii]NRT79451.1 hypothetical protein [Clostridium beijerinckii]OOM41539.1 hypothetical protein CBEIJ_44690 [Clostridium beijerinckii]
MKKKDIKLKNELEQRQVLEKERFYYLSGYIKNRMNSE